MPVLFSSLLLLHGFPTIPTSSYQPSNQIYFYMDFPCIGNVLVICYVISIQLLSKNDSCQVGENFFGFDLVQCFMLYAMAHFDGPLLVYFAVNVIDATCPHIHKRLIVFKRKRILLAQNKCDLFAFVHETSVVSLDRSKTKRIYSLSFLAID